MKSSTGDFTRTAHDKYASTNLSCLRSAKNVGISLCCISFVDDQYIKMLPVYNAVNTVDFVDEKTKPVKNTTISIEKEKMHKNRNPRSTGFQTPILFESHENHFDFKSFEWPYNALPYATANSDVIVTNGQNTYV